MSQPPHEHCHGEALITPEAEATVARAALAEGDLPHALFHIAGGLAINPDDPSLHALLEQTLTAVEDPLVLTKPESGAFYGRFAVHAWALARAGDHTGAVGTILRVLGARPDSGYTAWLHRWIGEQTYDADAVALSIDRVLFGLNTELGRRYGDHLRAELTSAIERARERFPDSTRMTRTWIRILRMLGRYDEALAVAEPVEREEQSYESAMLLGSVYRERGHLKEAIPWYELAASRRPDEFAIHLDLGDIWLDLHRWSEATDAYREALARDDGNAWAQASIPYAVYKDTGRIEDREALEAFAESRPDDRRAQHLARLVTPFAGHLPEPNEACIRAISGFWYGDTDSAPLTMGSSAIEAPSAIKACDEAVVLRGGSPITRSVSEVRSPDPRQPILPTAFTLWTYDGISPSPAMAPAPQETTEAVTRLASLRFDLGSWTDRAARIGAVLGAGAIEGLLGLMVNPPPPPERWAPWHWRQQVVIAAGLVLAFTEQGWAESGRRAALHSLLFGPIDWTTTSGIVAAAQLARAEGPQREEILRWFETLAALPVSPAVYNNVSVPLVECMLQLDFLSTAEREALAQRRRGLLTD